MSLFSNLLNLHAQPRPVEDFFTEIVACFFEDNNSILLKWLQSNDGIILGDDYYSEIHVSTQKSYDPLDGHNYGSRPDILIELSNGTEKDVIFIESKIGSEEKGGQLKRYAEILAAQQHVRHRNLIFITRDYEPKNECDILDEKSSGLVRFAQLRWHEFYQFLQNEKEKFMPEIMDFMRANNMARNNMFSSIDILAMANFRKSLNLMEATLGDEVKARFKELLGTVSQKGASFTQFRDNGRYIIFCLFRGWHFWCGLGFVDMNADNFTDYPNVGVLLEVSPKNSEERTKIIKAMAEIVKEKPDIWKPYKLRDSNAWANISYLKSLQKFLPQEDHVSAIKQFFLSAINEVEIVKNKYPNLTWAGVSIDEMEE